MKYVDENWKIEEKQRMIERRQREVNNYNLNCIQDYKSILYEIDRSFYVSE